MNIALKLNGTARSIDARLNSKICLQISRQLSQRRIEVYEMWEYAGHRESLCTTAWRLGRMLRGEAVRSP